ncbi:MAG TPA: MBL fold metallo-hydrolase [Gemmatimonadaceae bacterium]|nr:MBL fold metallo-hydrolase [Gemmatimonadaceae bacterium]
MTTTHIATSRDTATLTYVGGPTALIELRGLRFLTDPTFDSAGARHPGATGTYVLEKTMGPALDGRELGHVDAVLLSHDHHADNLDGAGRAMLRRADRVLTTAAGAERLGGHSIGMRPWDTVVLPTPDGREIRVTATPARHGPEGGDRGPVVGFVLQPVHAPDEGIYVTGDTVWYEGIAEVARRFAVRAIVAFLGAARVAAVGPSHITLTAEEGVELARAFPTATVVPLHFEGWAHFTEGRSEIAAAFASAGLEHRLRWPEPGRPVGLITELYGE